MTVRVRFAPSPTGYLHVGNARTALINWLFAARAQGRFILRIDDTDAERSRPEYAAAIDVDLHWLGLAWAERVVQSSRLGAYAAARQALGATGRLYACYETAEELETARRLALSRGRPPVYDRAGLDLDAPARSRLEAEGRSPHFRFRLDDRAIAWQDGVRGPSHVPGGSVSDPVLFRADGRPTYTLASVVDDIDLAISDVIRGEDHAANTAVQIQIFQALGAAPPRFAHHALLVDASGAGFSKRLGSLSLRALREEGVEAMALASLLARLGTADAVTPEGDLAALTASFDLARLGRAPARFDAADLWRLNAELLRRMPFAAVAERLAAIGLEAADARFWEAVRGNLTRLAEARDWWQVVRSDITPVREDPDVLAAAARLLPAEPWDETTWAAWTGALAQATGRKGKALYHPLRLALTARDSGPELKRLLPLLGRVRTLARLQGPGA
ncbi:MAG: glutamate--tRNA ligase [Alphaproteobacteria bacterium]|nr:glutamate--tRNA ligase [Alphaproteobacteria bacterium]